jgi:hypothetical protein
MLLVENTLADSASQMNQDCVDDVYSIAKMRKEVALLNNKIHKFNGTERKEVPEPEIIAGPAVAEILTRAFHDPRSTDPDSWYIDRGLPLPVREPPNSPPTRAPNIVFGNPYVDESLIEYITRHGLMEATPTATGNYLNLALIARPNNLNPVVPEEEYDHFFDEDEEDNT